MSPHRTKTLSLLLHMIGGLLLLFLLINYLKRFVVYRRTGIRVLDAVCRLV